MKKGHRPQLESIPVAEALDRFQDALREAGWAPEAEIVPVDLALGRTAAEDIRARISAPHYDASAMDGVAVTAAGTAGASPSTPVTLAYGDQAIWVDTGDPLPPGKDAVIIVEEIRIDGELVMIDRPTSPGHHVRPTGEDAVAQEVIVPRGALITPPLLGALVATGVLELPCYRQPRVTFIPTGSELVQPKPDPAPGEILEFNSRVILSCVQLWGGLPVRHPIVRDDYAQLRAAIEQAVAQSDIVIVNAGSSAGSEDFTVHVLGDLGCVVVHGVAMKPGKPVMLAVVDGKPVLGLPGYPVSTYLTADRFLKPLVYQFQGSQAPLRDRVQAHLTSSVTSPSGIEEYVRVTLTMAGERVLATPIVGGAGMISSLAKADGLLVVPAGVDRFEEGQLVTVERLRP